MSDAILTCNAGSTNTKLALYDATSLQCLARAKTFSQDETSAWIRKQTEMRIVATSHRIVHGGKHFVEPVALTPSVLGQLEAFIPLAPLHQPAALKLAREINTLLPECLHIGCFDTAFHHTLPELEKRLPLPRSYHDQGMQRYGFHGLSYQYIASQLPAVDREVAKGKVIVAHLGGGASMCAMNAQRSVASTMGFSTLDGLMMSTRPGVLDAGALLYLLQQQSMSADAVSELLYRNSGLKGVSGISDNMQVLVADTSQASREAVELYCYLAAKQLAGLLPALGGLDALVFTGGIGENRPEIRELICHYLKWLPLGLDSGANHRNERRISTSSSNIPVYILHTDEELMLATTASGLLG